MSDTIETFASDFAADILPQVTPLWRDLLPLYGRSTPWGNLGAITTATIWLSINGLPGPRLGSFAVSSLPNAFVPYLRANTEFYLHAESAYLKGFLNLLRDTLLDDTALPDRQDKAWRTVRQIMRATSPAEPIVWRHSYLNPLTIGELISITDDNVRPQSNLAGGTPGYIVTYKDPRRLPFFCLDVQKVQTGPQQGHLAFRYCYQTGRDPVCAKYGIDSMHPLSQWLAGYETIPDQTIEGNSVRYQEALAGEWCWWPIYHPLRAALLDSLRERIE